MLFTQLDVQFVAGVFAIGGFMFGILFTLGCQDVSELVRLFKRYSGK
jgi:hypothetical protein